MLRLHLVTLAGTSLHFASKRRIFHRFPLPIHRRFAPANLPLLSAIPWVLWALSPQVWFTRSARFRDWGRGHGCKPMSASRQAIPAAHLPMRVAG